MRRLQPGRRYLAETLLIGAALIVGIIFAAPLLWTIIAIATVAAGVTLWVAAGVQLVLRDRRAARDAR